MEILFQSSDFWDYRISHSWLHFSFFGSAWLRTCFVAEDSTVLLILLPHPPERWDPRRALTSRVDVVLGNELRALCVPGKHTPVPFWFFKGTRTKEH